MNEVITLKRFADIDLNDSFFDSLKEDYPGFESWFQKKATNNEKAYVQYTGNALQAFLYLKKEVGEELSDVTPTRPACNRMKVGTFKIDAHNTKLGERFVKKIMDAALYMKADITSVCQIEEVKTNKDFPTVDEFLAYTNYYSIFDPDELKQWYQQKNCYVLKMTYNIALTKRVTNGFMVDELKMSPNYWGFFQLTDEQFDAILKKGEVDEGIIIN